ncbi:TetR/AcrR family transcriptional regulator [Micromonosporaceae bacterium Da 78-11]
MTTPAPTPIRADARRNRASLVAAAQEVFGDAGLDAPLDDVAKRAGVGSATLYRRFSNRQELLWEVFADRMSAYLRAADEALAMADPWAAFVGFLHHACELQAGDRGLSELLTTTVVEVDDRLTRLRLLGRERAAALIARAQATGELRLDFTPQDFILILMANDGLVRRTAEHAPDSWRRQLALTVDGLHRSAATEAPPAPPESAIAAAMGLYPLAPR